jgi:hypothetical protein
MEMTRRLSGGVAPRDDFLCKWGEGGEGMPTATSNRLEHGLSAAASMVAWRHRWSRSEEKGSSAWCGVQNGTGTGAGWQLALMARWGCGIEGKRGVG